MKDLIFAKKHEKSYTQVGYEEKKKKQGDIKSELTDIIKKLEFLCFVLSVKTTMKKKLDNKFWYLYKHCFDCQIDFENKLRLEGKV